MRFSSALMVFAACGHPANVSSDGSVFDEPDATMSTTDGAANQPSSGGAHDALMPDGLATVDALVTLDAPVDSPAIILGPAPANQIFNVWPRVANPGDTLMLEGTFTKDAVVRFPGGTTATLTTLSAHRASVVVPDGTTIGDIELEGGPNSHVVFHAHDYQLGFQKIEPYEQTDTARQSGLLAEAVYGHGSVTIGRYVYVFGGYNGTFTTHVERATLNADGTLGNFAIVPNVSLVHGRSLFATAVIGNYVYLIGGSVEGSGGPLAQSIESAPIFPDGTIGTFTQSSVALAVPRTDVTAAVVGNYLYVIGGVDSEFLASIERAPINTDGTIGQFDLLKHVTLALGVAGASAQVIGDQLYVIGGASTSQGNPSRGVQAAKIHKDGTIDTFATVSNVTLLSGRSGMATAVLGNWLYVFGGGFDYSGDDMMIQRAPIHGDHSLGTFQSTNRFLPQTRYGLTVALSGTTLHVIGGARVPGSVGEQNIFRAQIDIDGGLVNFADDAATLATPRSSQGLVTSGDGVYLLGGMTGPSTYTASVERAQVVEGQLGSFTNQASVTLATARAGFATAVIGRYVYVIGGRSSSGVLGTIERAEIAPDGTLGTFAPFAGSLVTPRADYSAVVVNGIGAALRYLYVFGGTADNGTILGSVEVAPIAADGTLGAFATVAFGSMTTPRYQAAVILHQVEGFPGSWIYVVGGRDANGYLADIERGYVDGNGTFYGTGHLDAIPSLGTARAGHALSLIGDRLYVFGGANASGALDSVEVATFGPDAAAPLTPFAPASGVHLRGPRAYASCTVIANELYEIGGQSTQGPVNTVERARLH